MKRLRAVAAEEIGAAAQAGDRSAYLRAFQRFERAGSASSGPHRRLRRLEAPRLAPRMELPHRAPDTDP